MASITPNPNNRGYLLPHGCKDLMDVLRLQDQRSFNELLAQHPEGGVQRGGGEIGKISQIEQYVKILLASRGQRFALRLSPLGKPLTAEIIQMGETRRGAVIVQMNTDLEKGVQDFFARHGLPPVEANDSATPKFFDPNIPVYRTCEIWPLPADAPSMARLLAACFHEVCGLTDDSALDLTYDEITKE